MRCSVLQCVAVLLQCVAVCCIMLQCVAVCCSVLQCVAVRQFQEYLILTIRSLMYINKMPYTHAKKSSTHQRKESFQHSSVAVCCSVLQCVATLQHIATQVLSTHTHKALRCVAMCCSVLQCVAVCCNTATHCNTSPVNTHT